MPKNRPNKTSEVLRKDVETSKEEDKQHSPAAFQNPIMYLKLIHVNI